MAISIIESASLRSESRIHTQHAGEALQWISSVLLVGIELRLLYLARRGKISKKTCSCCRDAKIASEATVCSTPAKPVGSSMRMIIAIGSFYLSQLIVG